MKKRLKIIGIILGSVFILGLMFFMLCFKKEVQEHKNKEYAIDMFKLDEILSITIDTLSQYDGEKEFKDEETIEKIYKVFANRKTNVESIDDVPANPDNCLDVFEGPVYQNIDAVKNNKLFPTDLSLVYCPGVRVSKALDFFIESLYPDMK